VTAARRACVGSHITTCAAVELIGARPTRKNVVAIKSGDDIIARPAGKNIGAGIAAQGVIECRAGEMLDSCKPVALRIAARADTGRETHRDADAARA
jgi:hypothetical protein